MRLGLLLVLLGLGVFVTACRPDDSHESTDIQYLHDSRTDLCFATRYGGMNVSSYTMVLVPCSPAVLVLTSKAGH